MEEDTHYVVQNPFDTPMNQKLKQRMKGGSQLSFFEWPIGHFKSSKYEKDRGEDNLFRWVPLTTKLADVGAPSLYARGCNNNGEKESIIEGSFVMADTAGRTRQNQAEENRLKHACDAGMVSGEIPSDSEDSNNPLGSDSVTSESPPRLTDLAASFRVFSESMARMDRLEMEMIKAREASRLEAENRRMELEAELTRMMLQTQLQIASIVAGKGTSRKRKRIGEEEEMPISSREGALLLSLLQCNFFF